MNAFTARSGDWALVTGAGRGIGRFLCRHFAAKGMRIAAVDIDHAAARETIDLCPTEGGALRCDVSDHESVLAAATELSDANIAPSLVWLNAGAGSATTVLDAKPHALDWLLGVNVYGPIRTAQAFVPLMPESGPRHVGITASSASVTPVSGPYTLYATTKQMTAAIGEALMAELAPKGVGVTILCPGILDTEIWNAAQARPERFGGARQTPGEVGDHWRAQPGPDVLARGLDEALAAGGGWCIVPTEIDTEGKMADRHKAQSAGLKRYAVKPT